jgi:D-apionolactonase
MADKQPPRAIKLFGTEVRDTREAAMQLRAGPLEAELDNGGLRYIKLNGTEVLRAISFLVRDENWGTYNPEITHLKIEQGVQGFAIAYDARCARPDQALSYRASITGKPDGTLAFDATAKAETDFLTARTGFVVLHPLTGCTGRAVRVLSVDGSETVAKFPEIIDPVQPFLDIRALSHEVLPGVWATCRLEGDTYEMEDHRNWSDASYKTYVRPLASPWPYTIAAGDTVSQSVSLTFSGSIPEPVGQVSSEPIRLELRELTDLAMPLIGVGVPATEVQHAIGFLEQLKLVAPQFFVCRYDLRYGHDVALLRRYKRLCETTAADCVLEAVLPNEQSPAEELTRISRDVAQAKLKVAAIAVSPAPHLKSISPGSPGPPVAPLEETYAAARAAFRGVALGGGVFSYFTELNRKRPPAHLLDFVTNTTCPTVHAADDRSVMETLEALPHQVRSARAFIGDKPYRVGPSSLAPRETPYGADTVPNPANKRICLAKSDPRQRGLFGAAWVFGYTATLAKAGVEAVALGSPTGPAGIIHRRADYPQPWYDGLKGPAVYPAFHVVAGLARAAGRPQVRIDSSNPRAVECVAYRVDGATRVWLANLTHLEQTVELSGLPGGTGALRVLDEDSFVSAASNRRPFKAGSKRVQDLKLLRLNAYAVASFEAPYT